MSIRHDVISETVSDFIRSQDAHTISDYINAAIGMHRDLFQTYISFGCVDAQKQKISAFIVYAEAHNTSIELLGRKNINNSASKTEKIRILVQKDDQFIQTVLQTLYLNIAGSI